MKRQSGSFMADTEKKCKVQESNMETIHNQIFTQAPADAVQSSNVPATEKIQEVDASGPSLITEQEKITNTEPPSKPIDSPYYFHNNLRKVHPYDYTYTTHCKSRWLSQSLLSVFTLEFQDRTPSYYVLPTYLFQMHDVLRHTIHRHEPPVSKAPIKIVFRDAKTLIIDKPSSIPIHPSGRYNYNTCLSLLKRQLNVSTLFTVNRIDRLTSGIVLMAFDKATSRKMSQELQDRHIRKTYYAKVHITDKPFPEKVVCSAPLLTLSAKIALNAVHPDGKPATTVFVNVFSGKGFCIVKCFPETGRTHQIRVHLKHLGFPIVNDPLYTLEERTVEKIIEDEFVESVNEFGEEVRGCLECSMTREDPTEEKMMLYLHAQEYSGDGWCYKTEVPDWATKEFYKDQELSDLNFGCKS